MLASWTGLERCYRKLRMAVDFFSLTLTKPLSTIMPGYIKVNILIAYIAKTHVQPRARAAAEYDDLTGRVINVPPQHNEVSRQGVSQP